jgi:signal recognition particle receptor subunit beta
VPHLNYECKELTFKLVYCGPGMSGKTTNLAHIHGSLARELRGEMIALDTAQERTLFFDFLPVDLGRIAGYSVRFNMYTVPGQSYYEASRRLILDGADGVVFVADSQPGRLAENLEAFSMMEENLRSYDVEPRRFPVVLQYNKRDCEAALPLGTLERELRLDGVPVLEAVAVRGRGVMETIRAASRRVVERFQP